MKQWENDKIQISGHRTPETKAHILPLQKNKGTVVIITNEGIGKHAWLDNSVEVPICCHIFL